MSICEDLGAFRDKSLLPWGQIPVQRKQKVVETPGQIFPRIETRRGKIHA
jgi:hypothetical protein